MGKIVSPAGEVSFEMKSLNREGQNLVVIGTMGVWESKIHLTPDEVMRFLIAALSSPKILLFILSFPIVMLKQRFRSKKRGSLATPRS